MGIFLGKALNIPRLAVLVEVISYKTCSTKLHRGACPDEFTVLKVLSPIGYSGYLVYLFKFCSNSKRKRSQGRFLVSICLTPIFVRKLDAYLFHFNSYILITSKPRSVIVACMAQHKHVIE